MDHPGKKRKHQPTWRCLFHGRWGCQYCGKPAPHIRPGKRCAVCGSRALVGEATCTKCKNGNAKPMELFDA